MTHPAKPALRALRRPFDDATYHPPVTQEFGYNNPGLEPSCFDYHDGVYGFSWESGSSQGSWHLGIDYGLNDGTPLLAVASGTVRDCINPASSFGFGNLTILDVGGGLLVFYAHQKSFGCTPGQKVSAGQKIGLVGSTGNSTGPHLHFALAVDDGAGYFDFYSPVPYLLYQEPEEVQLPTAGRYKVLVSMFMRTDPNVGAPHGAFVTAGEIVEAQKGWTTHWRYSSNSKGDEGWLFAQNLAAA